MLIFFKIVQQCPPLIIPRHREVESERWYSFNSVKRNERVTKTQELMYRWGDECHMANHRLGPSNNDIPLVPSVALGPIFFPAVGRHPPDMESR